MKSIKLHLFLIFISGLTILFGSLIINSLNKYERLRATEIEIENQILAEKKKGEELLEELEYNKSDAFVEKIARERLNLVMPDEILFYNEEQ